MAVPPAGDGFPDLTTICEDSQRKKNPFCRRGFSHCKSSEHELYWGQELIDMLKFKRIKALLLALVLSLSLTACSEEVTGAIVDEVIDIAVSEVVDVLTEESGETADAETPPAQEESSVEEEPAPEEDTPHE
jgi:hypothetical protein